MVWSKDVNDRRSQVIKNLVESKKLIQKSVEEEINVALEKPDPTGHGGTSTTGNVVKTLLNTNNRNLLTKYISNVNLKKRLKKLFCTFPWSYASLIQTERLMYQSIQCSVMKQWC